MTFVNNPVLGRVNNNNSRDECEVELCVNTSLKEPISNLTMIIMAVHKPKSLKPCLT
jgi:hypothetical protein